MELNYNVTYRTKDKGWQYIISYKTQSGKWKQKAKQGFKTKKDCKLESNKAIIILRNELNNISSDTENLTLKDCYDLLIDDNRLYRQQNTFISYNTTINAFEELKDKYIKDISTKDIQEVINTLVSSNLKNSTIKYYCSRLRTIFNYYIENYNENFINPVKGIKLNKVAKPIKRSLNEKEIDLILNNFKKSHIKYYIAILLCVRCGLRKGEMLGLTWNDIDSSNMCIIVNKQWKIINNRNEGFGDTKNKVNRIVPISNNVLNDLLEYKAKAKPNIYNRIIPLGSNSIGVSLNAALKEYNITLHELRHTYATNLIKLGIDLKTVSELIGDDISQVLKTYSHVNDDMRLNAINIIQNNF